MRKSLIIQSLILFGLLTVLTGVLYPALITGIAQLVFPAQANGSLVRSQDAVIGSTLLGQSFNDPKYFWGRPSATSPVPYNGGISGGSNLSVVLEKQQGLAQERLAALREANPDAQGDPPVDLLAASGSGLDPHISKAAAFYQAPRVAKERNISLVSLQNLIEKNAEGRQLGILGEERVNVLLLNLKLDGKIE